MVEMVCRSCRSSNGALVLDLGEQPACDYFPPLDDPGPDPMYPLRMWLCAVCSLAQLVDDPTVPEEPRGAEPDAMVRQAGHAVELLGASGWLRPGVRVAEYGSPHGGSWLPLLAGVGVDVAEADEPADVVLDCFGMMHCADQAAAIAERTDRVAPAGVLLFQYHSLAATVRLGQWNTLRHGHYAYYSLAALHGLLAGVGFTVQQVWQFDLFGGTVLVAATRGGQPTGPNADSLDRLLREEDAIGVREPEAVGKLQKQAERRADAIHKWLREQQLAGRTTFGYGAASRTVALLCRARASRSLLPGVADISQAKHGRRMPGTDIPVVSPDTLISSQPTSVLLFLPDLLAEVREGIPEVEKSGGKWVDVESFTS